ncbi:hypothetical protein TWF694_006232 [Orbilia ellipsospora]|uniref:Conidiation-specific protein 13 n=1 Tax=Orbilia ellipsospora TaxID=2528407 RepID=A0AAV9XMW5_9PEZI
MTYIASSLIAVLAAAGSTYAQLPEPYVNYPNGLSPVFDQGFFAGTASPTFSIQQWPSGTAPQSCVNELAWNGCISGRAVVYNVTYTDCPTPWVFCRCDNADLSINQMADFFGRMPVHLRSVVRHPMAVHQDGCSAYATTGSDDGDIVMQGNCNTESIWLHETGHQLDARGLGNGVGFSTSPAWINALYADSCAADDYGNTALWEEFAQMTVVAQSDTIYNVVPQQAIPGCFNNQLAALEGAFKASHLTYGGTCISRIPSSPSVTAVWKRGISRRGVQRVGPCKFKNITPPHKH